MKTNISWVLGWVCTIFLMMCTVNATAAKSNVADANVPKGSKVDETKSPLGCRDVGYQFKLKVLTLLPSAPGDRQSLYFMLNRRTTPVNLYQMRKDDSVRSMYLNHSIRAGQWAALSTGEAKVNYICTIDDPNSRYGKVVDCGESLKVCEYVRVKYGMNNRGNFWVVNGNTRGGAVQEVLRYGIIPR